MFSAGVDVGAVVADIGTCTTRIGRAGGDMPTAYFSTAVGLRQSAEEVMAAAGSNGESEMEVEEAAGGARGGPAGRKRLVWDLHQRGIAEQGTQVVSPLEDALPHDWELMEELWKHAARAYLGTAPVGAGGDAPSGGGEDETADDAALAAYRESPILLAEKPFVTQAVREKYCEMLFETFQVPATFFSKDAVLGCYASGRTGGLAVDFGALHTTVTPVIDGFAETEGMLVNPVGGNVLDDCYASLLQTENIRIKALYELDKRMRSDGTVEISDKQFAPGAVHPSFAEYMRRLTIRDLKESVCRMPDTKLDTTDPRFTSIPTTPYSLPDGTVLEVALHRFQVPETLMNADLVQQFAPEVLQQARDAITSITRSGEQAEAAVTEAAVAAAEAVNSTSSRRGGGGKRGGGARGRGASSSTSSSTAAATVDSTTAAGRKRTRGFHTTLCTDSIPHMAVQSVFKMPIEERNGLLNSVVVFGGGSCMDGTPERLKLEMEELLQTYVPGWGMRFIAAGANERAICAWLGGSILGSMGSFHDMWLGRSEYEEHGASLVMRKCP